FKTDGLFNRVRLRYFKRIIFYIGKSVEALILVCAGISAHHQERTEIGQIEIVDPPLPQLVLRSCDTGNLGFPAPTTEVSDIYHINRRANLNTLRSCNYTIRHRRA